MSANNRNQQNADTATTETKPQPIQEGPRSAAEFSDWLDQSLLELLEMHAEFVTNKSSRRFFSR